MKSYRQPMALTVSQFSSTGMSASDIPYRQHPTDSVGCVCVYVLHTEMWVPLERASNPLQLELWAVMICLCGFWEANSASAEALNCGAISLSLHQPASASSPWESSRTRLHLWLEDASAVGGWCKPEKRVSHLCPGSWDAVGESQNPARKQS